MTRRRLDAELVRRGLSQSRADAVGVIDAGRVLVGGAPALRAARLVDPSEPIVVVGDQPRFVSRGGIKLDGALDAFGVDARGAHALDAGASTGGFTDCLLQRGAAHVVAVDVGYGQLHPRIRDDPRVRVLERCNVRTLTVEAAGGPADLLVADLSFISLTKVTGALFGLCRPGTTLVLLVKPQFEAGRAEADRAGGIIKDSAVRERVRDTIDRDLRTRGASIRGWIDSPLAGTGGNLELFVHAVVP